MNSRGSDKSAPSQSPPDSSQKSIKLSPKQSESDEEKGNQENINDGTKSIENPADMYNKPQETGADLARKLLKLEKEDSNVIRERIIKIVNKLISDWRPALSPFLLTEKEIIEIVYRTREVFCCQKINIDTEAPCIVVGDIHGQFEDLLAMLHIYGLPPATKYVFLGDYIDRGPFGIECLTLLFGLKFLYPHEVILLRGNHESRPINMVYGFFHECKLRYSIGLYDAIQWTFNFMPLTCRVGQKILCMHGGISEDIIDIRTLEYIVRPYEIPDIGAIADLTWADPSLRVKNYEESPRGAGKLFGEQQLKEFLDVNNLDIVIRAHQCVKEGFEIFNKDVDLVTIFSAPNYNGKDSNKGAVIQIDSNLSMEFAIFKGHTTYVSPDMRTCIKALSHDGGNEEEKTQCEEEFK
uniref:Serine/threonine-protein phosphatase n=1 Tax=Parastrongyloides trichosuri TaxID=131310 RepID=A0A0N4Z4G1_PARTI